MKLISMSVHTQIEPGEGDAESTNAEANVVVSFDNAEQANAFSLAFQKLVRGLMDSPELLMTLYLDGK